MINHPSQSFLEAQTFDEVVDELRATKRDIYKFF